MCEITEAEKAKVDMIILAFLLAYAPKQMVFEGAAELLRDLEGDAVPLE